MVKQAEQTIFANDRQRLKQTVLELLVILPFGESGRSGRRLGDSLGTLCAFMRPRQFANQLPWPDMHLKLRRRRTAGFSSIELILVTVVLIVTTFASLQFGLALIVKQAIAQAAIVAAREAGKGANLDELESAIESVLAGHQIEIGDDASFVLEDAPNDPTPQQRGNLDCMPPAGSPVLSSDEVRVTICVSLNAHPFLNILQSYGIDFADHEFLISSVAPRE